MAKRFFARAIRLSLACAYFSALPMASATSQTHLTESAPRSGTGAAASPTVLAILFAISFSHLLNDTIQSLIPAIYPLLKTSFHLSFVQVGLITLAFQMTASILQPFVGLYTDRRPQPYSLACGMGLTLGGLILLSHATHYAMVVAAAALVGMGSSIFHPESSRVAHLASGGRHGFAQSVFQVGGNAGSSLGPLLAALIVVPYGQASVLWFAVIALLGIGILFGVGRWYRQHLAETQARSASSAPSAGPLPRRVWFALAILGLLIFSKYFYLASLTNYYTFYLIHKFHLSVQGAQFHLFLFLFAAALGTILGGPIGDRYGRKLVIWVSILGVAPFTLALPHANLFWTGVLTVIIGIILASAFSAILVYAQELVPGKVGLISGLFFGLAFGMAGIGSAILGELADRTSIEYVFRLCAYLPLIGLLTAFLPSVGRRV
jgi:MFS transporter, FSR family, fosmidomycin resistance protein